MNHSFVSSITISDYLEKLDIFIIIFSLLSCFYLAKISNRNTTIKTNSEYLLMDKKLTLPFFIATLTATWYGGIFGVTQIAFEQGIYNFFTQGLSWYISYIIFAIFFVKKIRQHKVLSIAELIGKKFGPNARKISAFLLFFHALPVSYALSLGIFLQMCFGISLFQGIIIGTLLVACYCCFGGFRAIVITDAWQFVLMFSSVIILLIFCFINFGGLGFLTHNLPTSYFSYHGTSSSFKPFLWLFLACSSTLIHPAFYQRCLAANSDKNAILGIFLAIFCWLIFDLCTTFASMYAKVLIPDALSEQAYLTFALQLLPTGFKGLFIAGILATILSTLDSFLFISASSISYDIFSHNKNNLSFYRNITMLISAVITILMAYFFKARFENLWITFGSFFSLTLLPLTLVANFYKIKKSLRPERTF